MSEKTIKVLITGASGLLGHVVYKYFTNKEFQQKYPLSLDCMEALNGIKWDCVGLCHSRVKEDLKSLDLNNFGGVRDFVNEFKVNKFIFIEFII